MSRREKRTLGPSLEIAVVQTASLTACRGELYQTDGKPSRESLLAAPSAGRAHVRANVSTVSPSRFAPIVSRSSVAFLIVGSESRAVERPERREWRHATFVSHQFDRKSGRGFSVAFHRFQEFVVSPWRHGGSPFVLRCVRLLSSSRYHRTKSAGCRVIITLRCIHQ